MRFIIIVFLITYQCLFSINIDGEVDNYANKWLKLFSEKGEDFLLVDSVKTDARGAFKIKKEFKLNTGVYKIEFEDKQYIEFFSDSDTLQIKSDYSNITVSTKFTSAINTDFYLYLSEKEKYVNKMELLQPIMYNYPNDNDFYFKTQNEYLKIQVDFAKFCKELIAKNTKNLLSQYISIDQPVIVNPELDLDSSVKFLKKNFFSNARFDDPNILNSTLIPDRIIIYLALFMNKSLPKLALQAEYIKAVDYLMHLNYESDEIHNFVLEYLQNGFQKYHLEKVIEYISMNFRYRESCEYEERRKQLQEQLDKVSSIAIGNTSPPINVKDISGNEINLEKISSENTLIVFWASWCPHCKDLLNQLKEYYKSLPKNKLEILAISIDTENQKLTEFLAENNYPWTIVNEKGGWNSPLCEEFNIYATPTMILLDKEKKIIAKPKNLNDFLISVKH